MRISWLRAEEITAARVALSAAVAARGWDALFHPDFAAPPAPADLGLSAEAWARLSEHVARAERVSEVVRDHGLDAALTRFRGSGVAIEAATLAAAAQVADQLELALVTDVLACTIDEYLFYAPFLELLMSLGRADLGAAISEFERFVAVAPEVIPWEEVADTVVAAVGAGRVEVDGGDAVTPAVFQTY